MLDDGEAVSEDTQKEALCSSADPHNISVSIINESENGHSAGNIDQDKIKKEQNMDVKDISKDSKMSSASSVNPSAEAKNVGTKQTDMYALSLFRLNVNFCYLWKLGLLL